MPETRTAEAPAATPMAQLAACRHAVGICLIPSLSACELRGGTPHLDALAARLTGRGRSPAEGTSAAGGRGGWMRLSAQRALIAVDAAGGPLLDELGGQLARLAPDVAVIDAADPFGAIALVGPRAGELARGAAARTVPGTGLWCAGPGDWTLVLRAGEVAAAFERLLRAGRAAGGLAVDRRALGIHRVAERVAAGQRGRAPVRTTTACRGTGAAGAGHRRPRAVRPGGSAG